MNKTFLILVLALTILSTGTTATTPEASRQRQESAAGTTSTSSNAPTMLESQSMEALDNKYRLAIGDKLSFRVIEDEEEPRPLFVTDSGDLEVPLLGRVPAVGKTCKQLAMQLKTEFEKDYYHHATVIVAVDVMTRSRGKVYLVGPVRAPGPQEVPSDEPLTVSKAILRAGGFADFADRRNVKITRKSKAPGGQDKTVVVDVAEILERGRTERDFPLEPGDMIYIPERLVRF